MTSNAGAPHSLIHFFKHAKSLHEHVVFITVQTKPVPTVPEDERVTDVVDYGDGFHGAKIVLGFMETPDIPKTLAKLARLRVHCPVEPRTTSRISLGRESARLHRERQRDELAVRKLFFKLLSNNAVPCLRRSSVCRPAA